MKSILRKNQQGVAMIIAIMVLSLSGSIALIAFRSSTQELGVSRFTEHEMNSQYMAESGVEQVVSWIVEPESFPNTYTTGVGFDAVRTFFANLPTSPCLSDSDNPDLIISDDDYFLSGTSNRPFSELKAMGKITEIKLYAPVNQDDPPADGDPRLCTLEVTAISGSGAKKKIKVDLASSSIGPITAGIQGNTPNAANPLPIWVHWGGIRYTGVAAANLGTDIERVPNLDAGAFFDGNPYTDVDFSANIDRVLDIRVATNIALPTPDNGDTFFARPNVVRQDATVSLNAANPDDPDQVALRRFLRANGELYTVSSEDGKLEKNGVVVGTFESEFGIEEDENPNSRLVWISLTENSSEIPLLIGGGRYKGYFFFSGAVTITGGQLGREIVATTPLGDPITLEDINLEGLFYTSGETTIQDSFKAYGAFFSREGFSGTGAQNLEVWYNNSFSNAVFPGIRSVTPLRGTWATLDSDAS